MSQSFTSMDARTQRDEQLKQENKKVLKELRELDKYINKDEYGEYEIIEHDGHTVKHYIASGTLHSMPKDVPVYPEPEGDPSY